MNNRTHKYIVHDSGEVKDERLYHDCFINFLYTGIRENAPALFRLFTGKRVSKLAATINYDIPFRSDRTRLHFVERLGIDASECIDNFEKFKTPRQVFERKIAYWKCRPMVDEDSCVVSPADSRIVTGTFREDKVLYIKEKFFDIKELLGDSSWLNLFTKGDFAIFRLTPDKYHYNHSPVSGIVKDYYEIAGHYHSCNPTAVIELLTPYSKNKRTVTIIDTDVKGGSKIGIVAMIEVVALMIGQIVQCYSPAKYDNPVMVKAGLFMKAGSPKSLFRPGSSTVILLFQKKKIEFLKTIISNQMNGNIENRYTRTFSPHLIETDIKARSLVARKK
ncbi:MAG: phosphatidylserine decarboxylase [Spirochaetota bacterium]